MKMNFWIFFEGFENKKMKRVYAPADSGLLTVQFPTDQNEMDKNASLFKILIRIKLGSMNTIANCC